MNGLTHLEQPFASVRGDLCLGGIGTVQPLGTRRADESSRYRLVVFDDVNSIFSTAAPPTAMQPDPTVEIWNLSPYSGDAFTFEPVDVVAGSGKSHILLVGYLNDVALRESAPTVYVAIDSDIAKSNLNRLMREMPILEPLKSDYVIADPERVAMFVREHKLRGILAEAAEPISRAFGDTAVKTLTIVEDEEGSQTLFCYVKFPGSLDAAIHALDEFDQDWWMLRAGKFAANLNFDFELV